MEFALEKSKRIAISRDNPTDEAERAINAAVVHILTDLLGKREGRKSQSPLTKQKSTLDDLNETDLTGYGCCANGPDNNPTEDYPGCSGMIGGDLTCLLYSETAPALAFAWTFGDSGSAPDCPEARCLGENEDVEMKNKGDHVVLKHVAQKCAAVLR